MGQSTWGVLRKQSASNMIYQALFLSLSLVCLSMGQNTHNLPVLFKYEEPTHSVAVFRGAQLKQAIAAGLVPGFGNLGSRQGKKIDSAAEDMAAAKAAADAKARAEERARAEAEARARAEAEARARAEVEERARAAAAARPSQLELAEQACVQACRNLAGQCRNNLF